MSTKTTDIAAKISLGKAKRITAKVAVKILLYALLVGIGFVFVYPLIIVFTTSGKDLYDLVNPLVHWIPQNFSFDNYTKAFVVLGGFPTLFTTIAVMLIIAAFQTFTSALVGYGLAKFDFPGKKLVFALIIITFVVPNQVSLLPQYVMFSQFKLLNSIFPVFLPAVFCQGIKNAIFILLFFQFFRMSPKALDEAARVDGAGRFRIFFSINLRLATPAIVIVSIFSFVWNWNETNLADMYFGNNIVTLPLALERFKAAYDNLFPYSIENNQSAMRLNEGIEMAGAMLSIIPLILLYVLVERKLVQSIDTSGITGE